LWFDYFIFRTFEKKTGDINFNNTMTLTFLKVTFMGLNNLKFKKLKNHRAESAGKMHIGIIVPKKKYV